MKTISAMKIVAVIGIGFMIIGTIMNNDTMFTNGVIIATPFAAAVGVVDVLTWSNSKLPTKTSSTTSSAACQ